MSDLDEFIEELKQSTDFSQEEKDEMIEQLRDFMERVEDGDISITDLFSDERWMEKGDDDEEADDSDS